MSDQEAINAAAQEYDKKKRAADKRRAKELEEITTYTSKYENQRILAEQVYQEGKCLYAIWDRKENKLISYKEHIGQADEQLFKPISDDAVTKGFIGLPSNTEEYGSDEELRQEIEAFIEEWLDIPDPHFVRLTSYNIMKSWVFERFHTVNYNRFLGEHGTGKSRALDVIGGLHYKPIATSGALTSAVLFRIIKKWEGTIIIDEADQKESDESQDIIKILNQGYEKGRPVMRCDPNTYDVEFFDTFGPKVIATRRLFTDKALESRCITHVMTTTARKDIPPNLNEKFSRTLLSLRNKLLLWRFRNYDTIEPERGVNIDLGNIEPRLRQVSTGIAAMLADKPEELDMFKQHLADYQRELRQERAGTIEGRIINAICELYDLGHEKQTAKQIIARAGLETRRGDPWNPRALSSYMKTLGFGTTTPERYNGSMGKYYSFTQEQLSPLLSRFGDDLEFIERFCYRVTEVTVVTDPPRNEKNTTVTVMRGGSENGNNSNTVTTVTNVTDVTDVTVQGPYKAMLLCKHGNYEDEGCLFCKKEQAAQEESR